jgi:hypothetical protein
MKISIQSHEWYPVYSVGEPRESKYDVEVDDATVARWQKAEDDFEAVQAEIKAACDAAWNQLKKP